MNIVFVEAVYNLGGAVLSTIDLCVSLKELGHNVLFIDLWGSNSKLIDLLKVKNVNFKVLEKRNSPITVSHPNRIKYFINILCYVRQRSVYQGKLQLYLEEFKADVVSVNNTKCLSLLKPKSKYKIQFFVRTWFNYRSQTFSTRFLLNKYKPEFVVVSESTKQAIFSSGLAYLQNIIVLKDAINTSNISSTKSKAYIKSWDERENDNIIRLLHSGGFISTKGQLVCLHIAKLLKSMNLPFKMTLAGIIYDGKSSERFYEQLVEFIKTNDLDSHVDLIVNQYDILSLYSNTDIFIFPSETEGLPRVILEAFSFGKPVIANSVGGVTDVVIDNVTGFLPVHNNINDYARYISELYTDRLKYKEMSDACLYLIEKSYTQDIQIKKIKQYFGDNDYEK